MPIDPQERERRHRLIIAHYAVENDHDLDGIMATFAKDGVMQYNHQSFSDDEQIRWAHGYMGMSSEPGAISDLRAIIDEEQYTAEETVIEGRMCGKHSKEFMGFEPTDKEVELPFVAFYRFDEAGKLTSERVVMNLASLKA